MVDFTKLKAVKLDTNSSKIKEILKNTQKAIQKSIEQAKNNSKFPRSPQCSF